MDATAVERGKRFTLRRFKLQVVVVKDYAMESNWRRGQDSNLHSLSAGGFQDRCTTIMRPLRSVAQKNIAHAEFPNKMATDCADDTDRARSQQQRTKYNYKE